MNYIELFANGGLTKSEKSEGEQRAIQLLESLQELTGVDPKQAAEILNQFKDDPETVNSIQEYVNLAVDPQSDENTRSNAISELTKIFNPSMESQYFKCGGKLQQLVTKFGKGGPVDCGCSGIKLDNGGKTISADGSITIVNPNTAQADTLGRYSYPSTNGKFKLLSNGERSATVWDNTGGFPIARYANETFMQNHPVRSFLGGYKPAPAGYFENLVDRVNNRFDENGVPTKQEGGELTRRKARELATTNKGFNNAQFNLALANAKNALRQSGLRGKDLRTRALAMASGYSDQLPTVEPVGQHNNIDYGYVDGLVGSRPTREQLELKPITLEETPVAPKQPVKRGIVNVEPITFGGVATPQDLGITRAPSRTETENGAYGIDDNGNYYETVETKPFTWGNIPFSIGGFPTSTNGNNNSVQSNRNSQVETQDYTPGLAGLIAEIANRTNGNNSNRQLSRANKSIIIAPSRSMVPAGGGSYSWMQYKQGGQIEKDITKTLKCGGKTKKK